MGRSRPVDFVGWRLYRRTMLVPVLALLVLLATSFRADAPAPSTLPPTIANDRAAELVDEARAFDQQFPDRRPGTPDAIDSAQWMADAFAELGLRTKTVPATTRNPGTGTSIGLVNVEATLPGRTRELVVIHAHRDAASAQGRGGDAAGQVGLLALARELAATRDRRRSYLFVSTDGATLNGAGARALANRLARRGGIAAVIGIDRLGGGETLRLDATPGHGHKAPLGLVQATQAAVQAEGGASDLGPLPGQLLELAMPVTLREHGQLLRRGLPALSITAGDDQLRGNGDRRANGQRVGAGLRSVQRLAGTLEQVDQLQTVGRTWIASDRRVYRGWALKLLIASLLIPVWVSVVDMLMRHRRGWNLPAAVGTGTRTMLGGMAAIALLWLLTGLGLLPASQDRPPNPGALIDTPALGLVVWVVLASAAWLLGRGPDWRRQLHAGGRQPAGPDTPEVVLALLGCVALAALTLALNPYAVLLVALSLHAWLALPSWRVVFNARRVVGVWSLGLIGPMLAVLAVGAAADTGLSTPLYALQLLQTRSVNPALALLLGCGLGLAALLLIAGLGRVARPMLPQLRALLAAWRAGDATAAMLLPVPLRSAGSWVQRGAASLRLPERPRRSSSAPQSAATAAERARQRSRERARRNRVESR